MRYLVLSDVHANLEALEGVLAEAGPVDAVINLGDLVGYGPNPNEVVDRVASLPLVSSLLGNHDLAALGRIDLGLFNPVARAAAEWTATAMSDKTRRYLGELTSSTTLPDYYLAHASPRDPVWEYMESPIQGPPNFALFTQSVAFVGHTHVPRVFEERKDTTDSGVTVWLPAPGDLVDIGDRPRRIINPGGVGQPRNGDPRAGYAVLDSASGRLEFSRVEYPVEVTQKKIIAAGLPRSLAARLALGR